MISTTKGIPQQKRCVSPMMAWACVNGTPRVRNITELVGLYRNITVATRLIAIESHHNPLANVK